MYNKVYNKVSRMLSSLANKLSYNNLAGSIIGGFRSVGLVAGRSYTTIMIMKKLGISVVPSDDLFWEIYRLNYAKRALTFKVDNAFIATPKIQSLDSDGNMSFDTPFAKEVNELLSPSTNDVAVKLRNVLSKLKTAYELAGVGRYGALFLVFDDSYHHLSKDVLDNETKQNLIDIVPLGSNRITKNVNTTTGDVESYNINFNDGTKLVHPSRVMLITDNGTLAHEPRLQNMFMDLVAIGNAIGASAYSSSNAINKTILSYKTTNQGEAVDFDGGDVESDSQLESDAMEFTQGTKSTLLVYNDSVGADFIQPKIVDISRTLEVHKRNIANYLDIPFSIFDCREVARFASVEDKGIMNEVINSYRENTITPYLITPFVDLLITLSVVSMPVNGVYKIVWVLPHKTREEKQYSIMESAKALNELTSGWANPSKDSEAKLTELREYLLNSLIQIEKGDM